jgi:hypothetical protein
MLNAVVNNVLRSETNEISNTEKQRLWDVHIQNELARTKTHAASPDAKFYSWETFRSIIKERHGI